MPRRRNRFADLERQLRAAGGVAAAGSRLGNFADFKAGKRKIKISVVLSAADKKRYAYGAYPFNVSVPASPTAADLFQVTITKYSTNLMRDGGVKDNDLGLVLKTDTVSPTVEPQYYPALIKAFFPTSATAGTVTKTSDITGDSYKRVAGKSASAPFGRQIKAKDAKTADATATLVGSEEEDVKKYLMDLLKGDAQDTAKASSVSYEPEVFRGRTAAITAGASF